MCSNIEHYIEDIVVKQEPKEDITQQVKLEPPTEDEYPLIKHEIKDEIDVGPTVLQNVQPNFTAKPPKTKAEYQKEYRERQKAKKIENKQESTAKPPKTNAEHQKAFRERQKMKKIKNKRERTWSLQNAGSTQAGTADNNTHKNCKQDDMSTENDCPKIKKEREEFSCKDVRSDIDNITKNTVTNDDLHKTKMIKIKNVTGTLGIDNSGAIYNKINNTREMSTADPLHEAVVIRNYSRAKHTIIPNRHYINNVDNEEIEQISSNDMHIITNGLCECQLQCYKKFTKKQTLAISKEFAKLKPRQQNNLIRSLVSQVEVVHKMENRRRTVYFKFFLPSPKGPEKIRVCKNFFVKSLGFKKDDRLLMRLLKQPDVKR